MGRIYRDEEDYKDIPRALRYFKEGVKNGSLFCHAEMAITFDMKGEYENAEKCWHRFFSAVNVSELVTDDYVLFQTVERKRGLMAVNVILESQRPVFEKLRGEINQLCMAMFGDTVANKGPEERSNQAPISETKNRITRESRNEKGSVNTAIPQVSTARNGKPNEKNNVPCPSCGRILTDGEIFNGLCSSCHNLFDSKTLKK